jgi:hypothetical protein
MKKYAVTIKGVTPLLMNKPKEYGFDDKLKVNNPNIDREKEALDKIYSNNGVIYQPANHIYQALIKAASDISIKGKGKRKYSSMIGSMINILPDAIPHKKIKFDIFSALVVIPSTKGRIICKRPRFNDWELDFNIESDDEIPSVVLKEALDRAGKYVGIGDWRPAKKGFHGKFMVTKFEEVN